MSLAAYQRALKLCAARGAGVGAVRALGVAQSLATVALAIIAGLFLALLLTRGKVNPETVRKVALNHPEGTWLHPSWLKYAHSTNTGLYPIVVRNAEDADPLQQLGARCVAFLLKIAPPTRTNLGALLVLMAMGLAIVLLLAWLESMRRVVVVAAASGGTAAVRRQLHRQIYRLGQSALPTEGIEPTVELFTDEVERLHQGLLADLDAIPRARLGDRLDRVGFLPLLVVDLGAGLLGRLGRLVPPPVGAVGTATRRRQRADAAAYLSLLQQDLGLVRTVRVFGMEGFDNQRFDDHLEGHRTAEDRRLLWTGPVGSTGRQLIGAAAVLALGSRPRRDQSSAADRYGGGDSFGRLAPGRGQDDRRLPCLAARGSPSRPLGGGDLRLPRTLSRTSASRRRYFLAPLREGISFENVTLSGPSGKTLLDGVTFEILAKSRNAIMGRDEESKHALACLIPRLIDPKVGRVRADGMDLREVTLESLRAQVATVFQNDLVFSDSVFNNIGLGEPSHGLPRVIHAAKIAHAS